MSPIADSPAGSSSARLSGERVRHVVIGAGGFIGGNLVRHLCAARHDVLAVDQDAGAAGRLAGLGAACVTAGVDSREAAAELLKPGDIVHLLSGGALPDDRGADARRELDQTVGATLSVLDGCVAAGVRRVIFPSSGGTIYGPPVRTPIAEDHPTDPISAYGVQKLAVEKYLAVYRRLKGLDSVVARIANPFGPGQDPSRGQGLVASLVQRALAGRRIEIWGDGEVVRDYLYIDDLCAALSALAAYEGGERVFNIGSGAGRSVNQVIEALATAAPELTLDVARLPGRAFDVPVSVLDVTRISRETDWRPATGFAEGLARTLDWQRSLAAGERRAGGE